MNQNLPLLKSHRSQGQGVLLFFILISPVLLLEQQFSKVWPQSCSHNIWELGRNASAQLSQTSPPSTESETLRVSPAICIVTNPPGVASHAQV